SKEWRLMNRISCTLMAIPLAAAFLSAQETPATQSPHTNSWTGLLVAAGCTPDTATSTSATAEPGMPRRTSTPAREQNTTYKDRENKADRSTTTTSDRDRIARRT